MTLTPSRPAGAPAAQDLVSLTIDGIEVSVPKGTLLIRAAAHADRGSAASDAYTGRKT